MPVTQPVVVRYAPPTFDGFFYARQLVAEFIDLVPVALVAHLFARAGRSMRELGFDLSRPRFDLTLGAGLMLAAQGAAIGATALAGTLGLPFRPLFAINQDAHISAAVLLVLSSAVSAVSEEVIVNGYVITRLEQMGWRKLHALLASAGLRAVFHLYQGIGGFIYQVVGGLIAGWIFQRTRRVMPLVIAHFLIDATAYLSQLLLGDRLPWLRWGS